MRGVGRWKKRDDEDGDKRTEAQTRNPERVEERKGKEKEGTCSVKKLVQHVRATLVGITQMVSA